MTRTKTVIFPRSALKPAAFFNTNFSKRVLGKHLLIRTVHGSKGPQDDASTRWLAKIDTLHEGRPLA